MARVASSTAGIANHSQRRKNTANTTLKPHYYYVGVGYGWRVWLPGRRHGCVVGDPRAPWEES